MHHRTRKELIQYYLTIHVVLTTLLSVGILSQKPPFLWWIWVIASVNLSSFLIMGWDKLKANGIGGEGRIPERALYLMALLGGSPGVLLGINVFRHKSRKESFQSTFAQILFVQIVLIVLLLQFVSPQRSN